MLDRDGLKDGKDGVGEYGNEVRRSGSQMELSFMGPRHGVAAWLAAPARMGSLEFVSPRPSVVSALLLRNLAEIFDSLKELATASNPHALDNLSQQEQTTPVNLRYYSPN